MTTSTERPTPETDAAYAVQMSNGYYVGIWRDKETADAVCAKAPGLKGDRVVELVPTEALTAERAARERAEAELKENEAVINVWRGRTQRAEAERDALAEALREAMMDCDHMLLSDHREAREWRDGVRKCQGKVRAALAALERGDGKETEHG